MPLPAYASNEYEFWYNVSPQEGMPLAGQVDLDVDVESVSRFFQTISRAPSLEESRPIIAAQLSTDPDVFGSVRQFLGISDKRAYLDLSYLASRTKHPTESSSLCGCQRWTLARHPMPFFISLLTGRKGHAVQIATAEMVTDYLIRQGVLEAARGFGTASRDLLELVYKGLIAPKEYQQKAAKRRGHGCEAALASVLKLCGATIWPEGKASNPMGATDPHLNLEKMERVDREAGVTHAFDMLVMSGSQVRIAIQSLIHTSDPGQYGVDKSNETVAIASKITEWNKANKPRSVELWGLIDGVGFSENKADTINKLLRHFHHFVQIRTLYKAPLRLHSLGFVRLRAIQFSDYYDAEDISRIAALYVPKDVRILTQKDRADPEWMEVRSGEAVVFRDR